MNDSLRVLVIGGSLGGLSAALYLRSKGCMVEIVERAKKSPEGKGAGIVAHPAIFRYLQHGDLQIIDQISVRARWIRYLDRDGSVVHEEPCHYRLSSYDALHRSLSAYLAGSPVKFGEEMIDLEPHEEGAKAHFAGGYSKACDLLVCSDGIHSTARQLLLPELGFQYAGYVGWRGTISEAELGSQFFAALSASITYCLMPNGHILAYPIPSNEGISEPGRSLINWVWYRNIAKGNRLNDLMTDREGKRQSISLPPGGVQKRHIRDLQESANAELPPLLAKMVIQSHEPFVQAIVDMDVPRMVFGRICLMGDAAFVARPHTAAGTAKAADDAWNLAEAVGASTRGLRGALTSWERGQLALGRNLTARAREAGNRLQFKAGMQAGDPLPLGLKQQGDGQFTMGD